MPRQLSVEVGEEASVSADRIVLEGLEEAKKHLGQHWGKGKQQAEDRACLFVMRACGR